MLKGVLLSSSPESAIGVVHLAEKLDGPLKSQLDQQQADSMTMYLNQNENTDPSELEIMLQTMLLSSSPESATGAIHWSEFLDGSLQSQLAEHQERLERQASLPQSMSAVLADARPIVVTSAASPFSVVEVNDAWVGLCGYSRDEALNRNLGDLLQGPDTNVQVAMKMVAQLDRENYGEAFLTNYDKSGRKFHNFVKIGKLSANDDGSAQFLVGVLEEIAENPVQQKLQSM
jgi:PAS domain S-box-containing protein